MERFDDSLGRITDLQWAADDAKVRSLLQDIFRRLIRRSHIQARLWMRTVALFWRCGWSLREIGDQFGVDRQNIWRIVSGLRREARRFFGQDGQALQPAQPTPKEEPKPIQPPIPDPTNESQEHWEAVLESHGLGDPDVDTRRLHKGGPVYSFAWRGASAHAESWAQFYEGDTLSKKPRFQRLAKTTSPRKQIGAKAVVIDGRTYQVRVFEAGVPAGCFRFWANPRREQASPNREYDPEEINGILAHLPTIEDVEQASRGNAEARRFLEQYQVRDTKSSLRVVKAIPETAWQPKQSKTRVKADAECSNDACTNGIAVGPENLALPYSRRHEAVRYLPARTTKPNTLCVGCEKTVRAGLQVKSDWAARQGCTAPARDEIVRNAISL